MARLLRSRIGIAAIVGLTAVAAGAIFAATYSSTPRAQPMSFQTAQRTLGSSFGIYVSRLPGAKPIEVTKARAEATALHHANVAAAKGAVSAFLVETTDLAHASVTSKNRTVWLVLVPGQQVPIIYPLGKYVNGAPRTYAATAAEFIDAQTGKLLETAELNS